MTSRSGARHDVRAAHSDTPRDRLRDALEQDRGTEQDPERRAEAVRRLGAEFGELTPNEVATIVDQCCADLRGAPAGALPELVERLARERLETQYRANTV